MPGLLLERIEWLFPLCGRWLRYLLWGVLVAGTGGLWGICLSRAAAFWLMAREDYLNTPSTWLAADLRYARFVGASYLLGLVIGLGFLLLAQRKGLAFLGICGIINAGVAAWLITRRPEAYSVFVYRDEPLLALAANLSLVLLALAAVTVRQRTRGGRSGPYGPA